MFILVAAALYAVLRTPFADIDIKKLAEDVKSGKRPKANIEDPKNGVIAMQSDGFTLSRGDALLAEVKWDQVREIRGYKADLFTTDLICWGFCCGDEDRLLEVHEEMAGFDKLQESVQSRFGVTLEDWFGEVAFPAFATNMTVIWPKKGHTEPGSPADCVQPPGSRPPVHNG